MAHRFVPAVAAIAVSLLAACNDQHVATAPLAPRQAFSATPTVSGNVLGPDGANICNTLSPGAVLFIRLVDLPNGTGFILPQPVFCPNNSFAVTAFPGTYLLRVQVPETDPAIGLLPWRTLDPTPFSVGFADVSRDIRVLPGTGLGGRASLDGAPLPGVDITLTYDQAPGFAATLGTSGTSGSWVEFFGRDPAVLQNGIRYQLAPSCEALGTTTVASPPTAPFVFPTEVSAINCTLLTGPSVRFSHDRTRLVVTPMPGEIGGLSPQLPQYGEGWGVQFPVAPGSAPSHGPTSVSQLFRGGLIVGIRPDRVLTGVDIAGYVQCDVCRDFGLDGKMSFAASPQFGKKVLWHYSDATSTEGVGLKLLQKSYDGVPPNDYVLFHFIFTNAGAATVAFYPGIFADWDVGDDPFDDVGATELDGRLMYMTSSATPGDPLVGTLLLGAPVAGNAVLIDFFQSGAEQVSLLAGDVTIPSASDPGDHRYIHSLGPITLQRGKSADIWAAVVAGEDHDQLLASAAAAAADVARRGDDRGGDNGLSSSALAPRGMQPPPLLDPRCKKGCGRGVPR